MVDVLHYYFEEDMMTPTPEYIQYKSHRRESIYRDLYGYEYPYAIKTTTNDYDTLARTIGEPETAAGHGYDDIVPFNPKSKPGASKILDGGYDVPRAPFDPVAAGL